MSEKSATACGPIFSQFPEKLAKYRDGACRRNPGSTTVKGIPLNELYQKEKNALEPHLSAFERKAYFHFHFLNLIL